MAFWNYKIVDLSIFNIVINEFVRKGKFCYVFVNQDGSQFISEIFTEVTDLSKYFWTEQNFQVSTINGTH